MGENSHEGTKELINSMEVINKYIPKVGPEPLFQSTLNYAKNYPDKKGTVIGNIEKAETDLDLAWNWASSVVTDKPEDAQKVRAKVTEYRNMLNRLRAELERI